MNRKDYATLLSEAAEHARAASSDGTLVRVELHPFGFRIVASRSRGNIHVQRLVDYVEVFAANSPLLKGEIDRCVAAIADCAGDQPPMKMASERPNGGAYAP